MTRAVRTWEFLPVVGARAGLFGYETGDFEAWVYPLKIFRDFHLIFHIGDRAFPPRVWRGRSLFVLSQRPCSMRATLFAFGKRSPFLSTSPAQ